MVVVVVVVVVMVVTVAVRPCPGLRCVVRDRERGREGGRKFYHVSNLAGKKEKEH